MPAPSLPRRILLLGYFDRGNTGDDLMRDALLAALPGFWPSEAKIEARRLPPFSRGRLLEALQLLPTLWRADLVLLAGGSHFHDRFGWRSARILALLLCLFALARLGGARVGFAGVGVGPLGGRTARALVRQLLRLTDALLVRDPRSARLARRLSPGCAVVEGLDLGLLLPPPAPLPARSREVTTLGVSITPYFREFEGDARRDARVVEALAATIAAVSDDISLRVVLLAALRPTR